MISESDKNIIVTYAKKYRLEKLILFGSSKDKANKELVVLVGIGAYLKNI